jgi:hypothetical protein
MSSTLGRTSVPYQRHDDGTHPPVPQEDAKNYHAWAYRQWVLGTYKLWEGELDFTEQLLREDVLNNSAWNHRFFCVCHQGGEGQGSRLSEGVMLAELRFVMGRIREVPKNDSAWAYALGWVEDLPVGYSYSPCCCPRLPPSCVAPIPQLVTWFSRKCERRNRSDRADATASPAAHGACRDWLLEECEGQ